MIPGQKFSPEAELLTGKFGNPTLLTMYKNEINTSFFNRYFHIAFSFYCIGRILSHYSPNLLRYLQFTICIIL